MASVKNFQLVESYVPDSDAKKSQEIDSEREYILQVGKVRYSPIFLSSDPSCLMFTTH